MNLFQSTVSIYRGFIGSECIRRNINKICHWRSFSNFFLLKYKNKSAHFLHWRESPVWTGLSIVRTGGLVRQVCSTGGFDSQAQSSAKLYLLVSVSSLGSEDQFRSLLIWTDKETVGDLLLVVRRSPEGGGSSCSRSSSCGSRSCGHLKIGKIGFFEFNVFNIL